MDIVAAKPGPKLEAVSSQLKGSLIHPNKSGVLASLYYSPDGKRIIAGDYPGGVLQVWDAATGKQLTKIETGYGYRGSDEYFFLTPDGKTVFVSRAKSTFTRLEKDGKKLNRWEFDGNVRAWDLATGELRETFRHKPPRNIRAMTLSPDGSAFMTSEELAGEYEGRPKRAVSLWDVKTGHSRPLPDGLNFHGAFSPDSKLVALVAEDEDHYATAVKLFDVATGKEKRSIPIGEQFTRIGLATFSPDGRWLIARNQIFPCRKNWESWQSSLKFWDAASGKEVASFPLEEKNDSYLWPVFSPDGRTLAVSNWQGKQGKLFLFDVAGKKLVKTVVLGEKAYVYRPAFSPDGKWIAAAMQVLPDDLRAARELTVEDLPQPRIHLIETATGQVRETLVAPQGGAASLGFSPDGKTLASGGQGRVLLWDLTAAPGSAKGANK